MRKLILLSVASLMLVGCNTDPSTAVHQPMTAKPTAPIAAASNNGSIYQAASNRPLFEDRRARFVGDTLIVNIVENSAATKSTTESSSRVGKNTATIATPTILGYTPKPGISIPVPGGANNLGASGNFDTSLSANASLKFDNKDSDANSNKFTSTITVTVIEVLPNGNLLVSGEKQVAVNAETEFIRLSGVVNPINITAANAVNSTQLADAHVETKGKQSVDTAQIVSMLARFFVTILPF